MTELSVDPEYAAFLAAQQAETEASAEVVLPAVGDIEGRREAFKALLGTGDEPFDETEVTITDHEIPLEGGQSIRGRLFTPVDRRSDAFGVYTHGGGMILGTIEQYTPIIAGYAAAAGVPLFAPDYRLAPEHPHPTPSEDSYAGLVWAWEHLDELGGGDRDRFFVIGDSAGGNLAAGLALMARDRRGPKLAKQILIYPMLDDRTVVTDPAIAAFLTWRFEDNITGWQALLGDGAGALEPVSPYAVPGRAADLAGLPEAFIDVGTLDIFRDEDIDYAKRLLRSGVQVELCVYPGVPHAWELLAPDTELAKVARANRVRAIRAV
ncbi:alpha/beta hydrolase [Pseudoclavibacter sp. 13-3]|uniref:alpha/beta hydrolase n=1 Tax=Pseudoclavibacter sp. 13-3 TaxID=2901228 RepID=UPI001E54DC66|nr:alpha/beta hydrolase [Pseudoclavibacter sp. 13-3]MCD7101110.1 alpha/beta hydrolase [Pseudoclavibacter sp. 13-3]